MKNFKRLDRGFTLVELAIVLAIGLAIAAVQLRGKFIEARDAKATNQGSILAALRGVGATYQTEFYTPLVNGTAIPCTTSGGALCFPDPYNPTIEGLRSWGKLDSTFVNQNAYGGGYGIRVYKLPTGCVAPNCDLFVLAYLTTPMLNPITQRIDGPSLGLAASVLESEAGFSTLENPGVIAGANGNWSVPNPVTDSTGNPVAGILAMRVGYGSSGMSQFMRRDGELEATGTQKMGGQDVIGVNNLRSAAIQNTGNATIGGALGVTGQTSTNGIANNGSLVTNATTINGTATINGQTTVNGTASITGNTTVGGSLGVTGSTTLSGTLAVTGQTTTNGVINYGILNNTGDVQTGRLYLRTVVANGASCAGLTGYQASTAAGSIASCINGTWQTPAANIPPPSPCNSTSVYFQGCTGTVPYTQSGDTASVSVTSGSGYATYSCNNGSWAYMSGNCTPPPADCPSQSISWGSCSATVSAMSHGASKYLNDTSGSSTGRVYLTCTNGNISESSPSCTTAPSTTSYSYPKSREGYSLTASPSGREQYCQNKGHNGSASGSTEANYGGTNMTICWSIDGFGNCTGTGNCSATTSCWIQTKVVCQ